MACESCDNHSEALAALRTRNNQLMSKVELLMAAGGMNAASLAGVGGPGWDTSCDLYRGFVSAPPQFTRKSKKVCDPTNPQNRCDAEEPMGGVATPAEWGPIAAGTTVQVDLFTTAAAVVKALSVIEILDSATLLPVSPEGVSVGYFESGRKRQQYPGWGANSKLALVGGAEIGDFGSQIPEQVFQPATNFSEQTLLNGQNNMPPGMALVNTANTANGFKFRIRNSRAAAIIVIAKVYLSYNSDAGE